MKILRLLSFAVCLFSAPVFSQKMAELQVKNFPAPNFSATGTAGTCFAGTFKVGQHVGQSNDVSLDTIFLCFRDSILIDHDGNAIFMDNHPHTPPGVGYIYYACPPTVSSADTAAIASDSCLFNLGSPGKFGAIISTGNADGDIWFRNFGTTQNVLNQGEPVQVWFAPTTLDDFDNLAWEFAGSQPCININVGEAFSVVYLNQIVANFVNNSAGTGCFGSFQLRGGLPEWDTDAKYSVNISLAGDPSAKAFVHNPPDQLNHKTAVYFSVSEPGIYNVNIEDGKSCGAFFQVDMSGCAANENVKLATPDLKMAPGDTVCVPARVQNFGDVLTFNFNLIWDESILKYVGTQNVHPNLTSFLPQNIVPGPGNLTFDYFAATGPLQIMDGDTLFSPCFLAVGDTGDCSGLAAHNSPSFTEFTNSVGSSIGFSFENGMVCLENDAVAVFQPQTGSPEILVFPNPLAPGETEVQVFSTNFDIENVRVFDTAGRETRAFHFSEKTGKANLDLAGLPRGLYFLKIKTSGGMAIRKLVIG